MIRPRPVRRLASAALVSALTVAGGAAQADTTNFVDLEAGLGFATQPGLGGSRDSSSLFGRISASGVHAWTTENSRTSLTGYVENSTYFQGGYGSTQIFRVGADTNRQISQNVSLYADAAFSGDFAGQLSNRILNVPYAPTPPDVSNPLPPNFYYPDLVGLSGRQYQVYGDIGASIRSSPRSSISLTAGAQRSWFSGGNSDANFNSYHASGAYSHQISERTSLGASLGVQRQDFSHGNTNVVNPSLTAHTQLSENLTADGSVGVLAIDQRSDGHKSDSVTASFSGSICSLGTVSQICAEVARDAGAALSSRFVDRNAGSVVTTRAGLTYFRHLSNGTMQASFTGVHYTDVGVIDGSKESHTYLSAVLGYDRPIGHRLFAGIEGGARKLFQSGPDPKPDFNVNVYVRYRLGDLNR